MVGVGGGTRLMRSFRLYNLSKYLMNVTPISSGVSDRFVLARFVACRLVWSEA